MITAPLAQTTSSAVTQLLRQSLDQGRWAAGSPLRQAEIAVEFGVSRVPVREALFQLQAEGLVQMVPNKGMYVRTASADELREWFRLRQLIESDVLEEAVPLHDAASLNRLETVQAALDKARSAADWLAGDREFHEALYAPAQRPEAMAIVRRMRYLVDRFCFGRTRPGSRCHPWQQEHHGLIRAVRRGDAAEGRMGSFPGGRSGITEVLLRPRISFAGTAPDAAEVAALHHAAHGRCYIANSIRSEVRVEPRP